MTNRLVSHFGRPVSGRLRLTWPVIRRRVARMSSKVLDRDAGTMQRGRKWCLSGLPTVRMDLVAR
jgi:hypothetical protein